MSESNTRAEIIETMARAMDTPRGQEYMPAMRQFAARALTALEASGRAVVPREPTEAMLEAGEEADAMYYEGRTQTAQIYKAMLAAALPPSKE